MSPQALEPFHFKALFNRGFSYDKMGEHRRAIADYTLALQVRLGAVCAELSVSLL